jgi:2-oxoacid:acceptor oxidoreductase gamma subunit (pyruvate/2-ketoisovalerate family)
MIEIRFHGRGGQGSVIASYVLAEAAFMEGKSVQAFPFFGVERRGAPVVAFTRISDEDIRIRHKIYNPDHVVVLDSMLVGAIDVTKGLKPGGSLLINTDMDIKSFGIEGDFKIGGIDASHIAVRHGLGTQASPIVNTAVMGAFARFTGMIKLDSIIDAISNRVPIKKKDNIDAAREAYEKIRF